MISIIIAVSTLCCSHSPVCTFYILSQNNNVIQLNLKFNITLLQHKLRDRPLEIRSDGGGGGGGGPKKIPASEN